MYKTAASVQQPNSPHPMRRIIYSTYGNIHLVPELRHMLLTNYFLTCSQSFVICSADSLSLITFVSMHDVSRHKRGLAYFLCVCAETAKESDPAIRSGDLNFLIRQMYFQYLVTIIRYILCFCASTSRDRLTLTFDLYTLSLFRIQCLSCPTHWPILLSYDNRVLSYE